jgi:hypothetical protein
MELGLGGQRLGLGLALLALGVEAVGDAVADQLAGFLLQAHGAGGDVALGIEAGEVGVGGGDVGGEHQPRLGGVGLRRAGLGGGGGHGRAVLAPEVQLPAEVEAQEAVVVVALRHELRRDPQVVALLHLLDAGGGGEVRQAGGALARGQGLGLAHAALGHGEGGRRGQRLVDQLGELGVAVGGPPAIAGPFRGRGGQRLGRRIAGGGLRLPRGLGRRQAGAGRQRQDRNCGKETRSRRPMGWGERDRHWQASLPTVRYGHI